MSPYPKAGRRGFLLIFGLLVLALLLVLGLGFLGQQSEAYRAATQAAASTVALECAMAGLEDARVKLMKDVDFPPAGELGQTTFSYTELLKDPDEVTVGTYTVTIDSRWQDPPVEILVIEVEGAAGDPDQPTYLASRRISVELDLAPERSGAPNPNLGRFINFQDLGSL